MQTSGHAVEFCEPGIDSRDPGPVLRCFLDLFVGLGSELARRLESAPDFPGCDPEDLRLRSFEDLGRTIFARGVTLAFCLHLEVAQE